MGRQVQLNMLPADTDALLREIRLHAPVDVVLRDGDGVNVQPLKSIPEKSGSTLILWNKQLMPTLQRKWIDSATPAYYRVDGSALSVLEFSMSTLTEWQGRPALTQGRIYGSSWGSRSNFKNGLTNIVRYIRKQWRSNPVSLLGGYMGPAASDWFRSGGLLLPMFVPPVTNDWIRVMKQQHPAKRKWTHWSAFVPETPSIRKSHKRHEAGLRIGCGKKPCACKNPRSHRTRSR